MSEVETVASEHDVTPIEVGTEGFLGCPFCRAYKIVRITRPGDGAIKLPMHTTDFAPR